MSTDSPKSEKPAQAPAPAKEVKAAAVPPVPPAKPPETAPSSEPAAVVTKEVPAAPEMDAATKRLREHLKFIASKPVNTMGAYDFQQQFNLGESVALVLQQYVADGFLSRDWVKDQGRYSLTPAGLALIEG